MIDAPRLLLSHNTGAFPDASAYTGYTSTRMMKYHQIVGVKSILKIGQSDFFSIFIFPPE